MSLTEGEKNLFKLLLNRLEDHLSNAGCNDLEPEMRACLTKEEWQVLSKEFYTLNGSPEDYNPNYCYVSDHSALYYLRHKAGLL